MLRLPVTANAQRTLGRELALLEDLAQSLPLPIPAIAHVARREGQLLLAAYRAIRGEPLTHEQLCALPAIVQRDVLSSLAAFLDALHAYPVSAARRAGVTEQLISGAYHAAQRELPGMLAGLLTASEIAHLDACFARYERVHQPATAPCAVLHCDLKPAHVLYDAASGQISGVLDWGDVSLGDPDFDLAVCGIFFGQEFLARLLEHLPDRDPAVVRDKASFFTTLRRLQDIRYVLDHGDPAAAQPAVHRLREHLADLTALRGNVWKMTKSSAPKGESPSEQIDARVEELGDWRGKTLSRVRALIKQADPEVVEEWKWRKPTNPGVPVWSHQGGICTGETYKSVVKLTFFKGASLEDPSGLFNSSLEGNTRRAIDFHEDDEIDEKAFVTLIRAAVDLNESSSR